MSSAYVGPYIECQTVPQKVIKKIHCCVNENCQNYHYFLFDNKIKFCAFCGSEIQKVEREEQGYNWQAIKPWQILPEDTLTSPQHYLYDGQNRIFMPNVVKTDKREIHFYEEKHMILFTDEQLHLVNEEKTWFQEKYKNEIEILEKAFGKDKVSVNWGVVLNNH